MQTLISIGQLQKKIMTNVLELWASYRTQPENYRTELGYMILPEHHNKGYVTEAVKTLLNFAFNEMRFNSIEATIDPENIASEKVLQKNGFVKEGHLIENFFYNGQFIDM